MIQCPECGEWIDKDEMDLHLIKTRPDIVAETLNNLRKQVSQHEIQRREFIQKINDLLSRLSS